MSTKPKQTERHLRSRVAGLALLLIGLIVGAIGAVMVVRTINLRHAYPRAVMTLMQTHVSAMQHAIYANKCSAAASREHFQRMVQLAQQIQPAFQARSDSGFMHAQQRLQQALTKAQAEPLADCDALKAALEPVSRACKNCHGKFR